MISILEDDSTAGAPRTLTDQPGPQGLFVVDWAAETVQGSKRLRNEDSWGQLGPVFAVADGMGGLEAGDRASAIAARTVVSEWFRDPEVNPIEIARRVNTAVRAEMAAIGAGGSTMSAVRIAHDQITLLHVGDSRIYRVRAGQAERLTSDHNLRTELLSAGIMPKSTPTFGPLRALTSYLGMPNEDLQVDVRSVAVRNGDMLVLCSDGVFDGRGHGDISGTLRATALGDAKEIARALTSGIQPDDATAVVMKIGTASRQQGTLS